MSPFVGITTYHREVEGRPRFTLPSAYVDAVRAAGATAILLAPGEADPGRLVERLDALVLSGGGDLGPELGAPAHPSTYFTCDERDGFEVGLVRAARERRLPTLAICRGMQVLNAAFGGTLHAHLPDAVGERVAHRAEQEVPSAHPVALAPGSPVAEALRAEAVDSVPSWHHQAIAAPGEGLQPAAWAEDGVIEALAADDWPELLAVQWHPELLPLGDSGRWLFSTLRDRARRR